MLGRLKIIKKMQFHCLTGVVLKNRNIKNWSTALSGERRSYAGNVRRRFPYIGSTPTFFYLYFYLNTTQRTTFISLFGTLKSLSLKRLSIS